MSLKLCPIAQQDPNALAIEAPGVQLTYRALDHLISKPVDPAPFIARKDLPTVVRLFALWRKGLVACPLSHRLPPQILKETLERMKGAKNCATLLLTSGTTGKPKLAAHSFANHLASSQAMVKALQLGPDARYLLNLPLFHVSGIATCLRTFLAGATLVLERGEGVTHLSAVPTQLQTLEAHPKLKVLLLGGAPLIYPLPKHGLASYGMTEMSSTIAIGEKLLTPLPNVSVKIDAEQQIWVRGEALFQGYFEKGAITLPVENGWFPTGDLGRWSTEHSFQWIGRRDRQFISGGENIQPEEIEHALHMLPDVLSAKVSAIDDATYGKRPIAEIVLRKAISAERIQEQLEEFLPRFKIPSHIFIKSALTSSGTEIDLPVSLETAT